MYPLARASVALVLILAALVSPRCEARQGPALFSAAGTLLDDLDGDDDPAPVTAAEAPEVPEVTESEDDTLERIRAKAERNEPEIRGANQQRARPAEGVGGSATDWSATRGRVSSMLSGVADVKAPAAPTPSAAARAGPPAPVPQLRVMSSSQL